MRPFASPMMISGKKKQTLFATKFSDATVGGGAIGWSTPWNISGTTRIIQAVTTPVGSRVLRLTKTGSNNFNLYKWDAIPVSEDFEALILARRIETAAAQEDHIGVMLGVNGASGAAATGLRLTTATAGAATTMVVAGNRYTNGAVATVAVDGASAITVAVNAWYWLRTSLVDEVVRTKLWLNGAAEPNVWTFNTTAPGLAAGGFGLINTSSNPNVEIGYVGVDIAGKTVPLPI